jgi:hypothetical protein
MCEPLNHLTVKEANELSLGQIHQANKLPVAAAAADIVPITNGHNIEGTHLY